MSAKPESRLLGFAAEGLVKTKLLCAAFLTLIPLTVGAQTADEIVAKTLAARGGLEKIKAVKAERVSGTITFTPGGEGPFVVELKRPGKMRMEMTLQGLKIIRVYDGKSAGWFINPFAENKDVQPMSAEDLRNISDESDFDGPLVDYRTKGNKIEFSGKEELDGNPVYRLKLTTRNGDVRQYLFDASSFLLLKWEGTRKMGDKEYPVESFFGDYRDVNHLKFAFEIDSGSPTTQQQQKIVADKIEINPQLDDARFAKPAPPAPASEAPAENPPSQ